MRINTLLRFSVEQDSQNKRICSRAALFCSGGTASSRSIIIAFEELLIALEKNSGRCPGENKKV